MKILLLLIGLFQMAVGCSGGSSPPISNGSPPNSDVGVCLSQPSNFAPCDVDQQTCMGRWRVYPATAP
jgi:hypothetical protein